MCIHILVTIRIMQWDTNHLFLQQSSEFPQTEISNAWVDVASVANFEKDKERRLVLASAHSHGSCWFFCQYSSTVGGGDRA